MYSFDELWRVTNSSGGGIYQLQLLTQMSEPVEAVTTATQG